jgi:phage shock protein E
MASRPNQNPIKPSLAAEVLNPLGLSAENTMNIRAKTLKAGFWLVWALLAGLAVAAADVRIIQPAELMKRLQTEPNLVLIDIRTPQEFAQGHIPRAVNLPLDQFGQRSAELAAYRDKEVILYCRTGRRVRIAVHLLLDQGFQKMLLLEGNILGWARRGMPLE